MAAPVVRVITTEQELHDLRGPWNDALARSPGAHAFLSWEWAATWWKHHRGHGRLHVLVAVDGDRVLGLAPLFQARVGPVPLKVLVGIGQENADYGGFVLGDRAEEVADALLTHLESEIASSPNTVVELTRLPDDGVLLERVRARYKNHAAITFDGAGRTPCHYLDLTQVEDPAAHVAKLAKRHDAPREYRRLGRDFDVDWSFDVDWPITESMDRLFELSERRWELKLEPMQGLFVGSRNRAFAVDVVHALHDAGWARLSFITAGGKPVAGSLGYLFDGRFSWHKTVFDPDFWTYSPGHLVLMKLLEETAGAGVGEFTFGRGDEPYKRRWVNGTRRLVSSTLRRRGAIGRVQRVFVPRALRQRQRWAGDDVVVSGAGGGGDGVAAQIEAAGAVPAERPPQ